MTAFVFVNNVSTTLAAAITSSATTISLASSAGLPTLATGQVMPLTLNDLATGLVYEIVYVTAISGSNVTVERAQEGTGAQAWNTGDYIRCSPTAGTVAAINGSLTNPFSAADFTSANGLYGSNGGAQLLAGATYTASVNEGNSGYVEHYVGPATTVLSALPLGQAQADFAAINGSASEAFNVADAATATEALPLGQAQADFAAINGSASEAFTVADASSATEALPLGQAQAAFAAIAGNSAQAFSALNPGMGLPIYISSSQSLTVPSWATRAFCRLWGGGGAGTAASSTNERGAGGGAGGYIEHIATGLTGTMTLTVGTGGAADGAPGGSTSTGGQATATGGGGGGTHPYAGGLGGTGALESGVTGFVFGGQDGGDGNLVANQPGGNGGGTFGGRGATDQNGYPGHGPGGGGGGAMLGFSGGPGANGLIIVQFLP